MPGPSAIETSLTATTLPYQRETWSTSIVGWNGGDGRPAARCAGAAATGGAGRAGVSSCRRAVAVAGGDADDVTRRSAGSAAASRTSRSPSMRAPRARTRAPAGLPRATTALLGRPPEEPRVRAGQQVSRVEQHDDLRKRAASTSSVTIEATIGGITKAAMIAAVAYARRGVADARAMLIDAMSSRRDDRPSRGWAAPPRGCRRTPSATSFATSTRPAKISASGARKTSRMRGRQGDRASRGRSRRGEAPARSRAAGPGSAGRGRRAPAPAPRRTGSAASGRSRGTCRTGSATGMRCAAPACVCERRHADRDERRQQRQQREPERRDLRPAAAADAEGAPQAVA